MPTNLDMAIVGRIAGSQLRRECKDLPFQLLLIKGLRLCCSGSGVGGIIPVVPATVRWSLPRSRSASLHAVGSGTAVRLTTCFRCWSDDFVCLFLRLVGKKLRVLLLSVLPVTGPSHCLDCVDPSCAAHTGESAQCLRALARPSCCSVGRFTMASGHVFSAPFCFRAFPYASWSHTVPTTALHLTRLTNGSSR